LDRLEAVRVTVSSRKIAFVTSPTIEPQPVFFVAADQRFDDNKGENWFSFSIILGVVPEAISE
jgi:hypothetical protein